MFRTFSTAAFAALALAGTAHAQNQPAAAAQAPQQITKADLNKDLDARFGAIDANKDGNVTKDEISAAQAKAVQAITAAQGQRAEAEFKKLDTNKDNQLSMAEFKAAAPTLRSSATPDQMLAQLDSNKDGKVSSQEFRAPRVAAFDKADANRDGTVTAQEVESAAKR